MNLASEGTQGGDVHKEGTGSCVQAPSLLTAVSSQGSCSAHPSLSTLPITWKKWAHSTGHLRVRGGPGGLSQSGPHDRTGLEIDRTVGVGQRSFHLAISWSSPSCSHSDPVQPNLLPPPAPPPPGIKHGANHPADTHTSQAWLRSAKAF